MIRKINILLLAVIISLDASAQSVDEKIANAMNWSDWFALDSIYNATPKDSINGFLEIFSRCLLGNRLNRPDVSIPAFQELLNTQSENLGVGNLVSSAYMFGMDLSRVGQNEAAAAMTKAVLESAKQYLDSATIVGLTSTANRYAELSVFRPYQIEYPDALAATVPFEIVPVGPKDKNAVLMHLRESYMNGIEADITFDTGAGTNIISPEMAEKYNLTPLDGTRITVAGIAARDGYIAMAKELKIGNITVRDVPFTVISMPSGNDEADRYIDSSNIVLGSELMLQLKDLTIDFANRQITVPTVVPERSGVAPNICFSSTMNMLAKGVVASSPMLVCLDSGDASFGSSGRNFFEANKDYITTHARLDSVREAGIGGVIYSQCYKVPDMSVSLGGSTVCVPEFTVKTAEKAMRADYDCILGVKSMMLFGKVRFNMVDFVLTTEPSANSVVSYTPQHGICDFKVSKDKGISAFQALGIIAVGVGRTLINPNAPAIPDL